MQSVSDTRAYAQGHGPDNSRSRHEKPNFDLLSGGGVGACALAQVPAAAPDSGEAAGLVPSPTSGPDPLTPLQTAVLAKVLERRRAEGKTDSVPPVGALRVDREASRLKRLKCSVLTAARLHVKQRARWKVAMVTLTYAPDYDWASNQVADLVRHIRKYLRRKGVEMRYVWVQEFTKKGRPHYHMLLWLPLGITLPKPDKRGWWPYGFTKIEWARNAVGYIAKYASKADSLHKPAKGARMHGNGGITGTELLEQRWWKLPSWLRNTVDYRDGVRRSAPHTGGGFVNPMTGETYRSPWTVFFEGGHVWIRLKTGAEG